MSKRPSQISLFWGGLGGGGAERVMLALAEEFLNRGIEIEIVLLRKEGELTDKVPSGARVIDLGVQRLIASIPALIQYFWRHQPSILLSAMTYTNRLALLGQALSGTSTPVVISEHGLLSISASESVLPDWALAQLMRSTYPLADRVIAVSEGVAKNISQSLNLRREKVEVVYNPVIGPETFRRAEKNVEHPWFSGKSNRIIIGVGRLVEEKNFSSLIRAFAMISGQNGAEKLAILGEGEKRSELENLADSLDVRDQVWMPGFVQNPLKYMARSDVFVLSSKEEGLGNALIEGMATGTPVISTDCEGGPNEVLEGGKYGKLVPPENSPALAEAIQEALDGNIPPAPRSALDRFRRDMVAEQYLSILSSVAHD